MFAPWDAAVCGFILFCIVYAYIVGNSAALRTVVVLPLALLGAQSLTTITRRVLMGSHSVLDQWGYQPDSLLLGIALPIFFLVLLALLSAHAGIEVDAPSGTWYWRPTIALCSGTVVGIVLLAALLNAAELLAIPGMNVAATLQQTSQQSIFLRLLSQWQALWYLLPALLLLGTGYLHGR